MCLADLFLRPAADVLALCRGAQEQLVVFLGLGLQVGHLLRQAGHIIAGRGVRARLLGAQGIVCRLRRARSWGWRLGLILFFHVDPYQI
ncbi:hypothetical protein D3C85_1365620 [compost metagenome]